MNLPLDDSLVRSGPMSTMPRKESADIKETAEAERLIVAVNIKVSTERTMGITGGGKRSYTTHAVERAADKDIEFSGNQSSGKRVNPVC